MATTFSIDSFTANFPGGGALSSLYQVSAAISTDHNSINAGLANFNFVCKGANLPTSALESTEVQMESDYSALQSKEQEIVKQLNEKYGPGNLDPATGVFTPAPTTAQVTEASETT